MEKDDAIERLEKRLDTVGSDLSLQRSTLYPRTTNASRMWKPVASVAKPVLTAKPLELLFIGSVAFFVIALIVAVFLFFGGNNTVSTENVAIQIAGPSEIGAGSTLSLQVVVTNRNAVPMELSDLIVEFPEGTRSAVDVSSTLPRVRESLGTIDPGESVNRTIRAVLFGIQGQDFPIQATVEYRVPSSNAIFISESTHTIRLNESPAAISVDALTEAVSGQKSTFTVSVRSNAPELLKDMLLIADYPPGFVFDSSSPAQVSGGVWTLGDIEPGGTREVVISGTFTGEEGESKVMQFVAGNRKGNEVDEIAAPLASADLSLAITKPFISVELTLRGERSSTHVISRGQEVAGSIRWTNNLPVRVQSLSIVLSLDGQVLDRFKVRAAQGFYNSNTSTVTWDRSTDPDLLDVAPGESGVQEFSFASLAASAGEFKNPEITMSVNVSASRLSETNVPESIFASSEARALVTTNLTLKATGGLATGVMPPKVGTPSSFLILWNLANAGSAIADARVSAILPPYVNFVEGAEGITYNATDRTVVWGIGDIEAGGARSRAFEISFTPSVSQVGTTPILLTGQRVTATDRFTRTQVGSTAVDLTTQHVPSNGGGTVAP